MRGSAFVLCLALLAPSAWGQAEDGDEFDIDTEDFDEEVEDAVPDLDVAVESAGKITKETSGHVSMGLTVKHDNSVNVYWLVPDGPNVGNENQLALLKPGEYHEFFTLPKQTWIIRDATSGDVIQKVVTKESPLAPEKQKFNVGGQEEEESIDEDIEDDEFEAFEDVEENFDDEV